MKVLLVGSGGREHALAWKLAQSPHVDRLWCAPGNGGIGRERLHRNGALVECVAIGAEDLPRLAAFAQEREVDLTVVGPDNPLALGIVDLFQARGLRIWGPNRQAAQFEASKVFSQQFMRRYGIPTARAGTFEETSAAKTFAASLDGRCAIKADGLALGKGVIVCQDLPAANRAIEDMLERRVFGDASRQIVIQEFLEGTEVSLHAVCDGRVARLFPTSQDHKPAFEGDTGPNTGGMGTYCPTPFLNPTEMERVRQGIVEPWLAGCRAEGIDYRGILYPGIMLTAQGPKVLEFNARFGDPETQVYLACLETDLIEVIEASLDQHLGRMELRWKPLSAVCVILASSGYPGAYTKGHPITGLETAERSPAVKVFHAGTRQSGDAFVTNGGRVLGVTAWAADLEVARAHAYTAVDQIHFAGVQFRRDIGNKAFRAQPHPGHS